ncbi:MAG: alpha-amylase family glycosyl hydrolase [Anaeromyxobacter sp.]
MPPTWLATIHHDGSSKYVSDLCPAIGDVVRIRLRVSDQTALKRVFLRTNPDNLQVLSPMSPGRHAPPARWYDVDLPITERIVQYRFVIEAEDGGVWWYSAAGVTEHEPLGGSDFRLVTDLPPPSWVRSTVFYQIFPDRFWNGEPSNDPQPDEYDRPSYRYKKFEYQNRRPRTLPWGSPAPFDAPPTLTFYGGDLPGIESKLPYLQDLGVGAIYLNPVFASPSNHRYDVVDHERVDPRLGGTAALAHLRQALTAAGMRYLLDVVPNHVSYWHPWFQAAESDPTSLEAGFFTFLRHPESFKDWFGWPRLDYASEELRRRMFTGHEAVLRRWLRLPYSADGWRVYLPNAPARQGELQPGLHIGRALRAAIKETRPDAYLLGENLADATEQLQGDQFDGLMNYRAFMLPLWSWLRGYHQDLPGLPPIVSVRLATQALARALLEGLSSAPWSVSLHHYNPIGSHDFPRVRSVLDGNDALHRLAAVVQFTFPGVPGIYYGDEIGMVNDPGLEQRACMVWDEKAWNRPLREFYKALVALRRGSPALQEGGFQVLAVEADTLAYQREGPAGRVIVVAHRGSTPRPPGPLAVAHGGVPDGLAFTEAFSRRVVLARRGQLALPELPQGATVWVAEEEPDAAERPHPLSAPQAPRAEPTRGRTLACPVCGKKDGTRRETRTVPGGVRHDRWFCLWCGATWT